MSASPHRAQVNTSPCGLPYSSLAPKALVPNGRPPFASASLFISVRIWSRNTTPPDYRLALLGMAAIAFIISTPITHLGEAVGLMRGTTKASERRGNLTRRANHPSVCADRCQPILKNISLYRNKNQSYIPTVPSHQRGVAHVTKRGAGCGGRERCS